MLDILNNVPQMIWTIETGNNFSFSNALWNEYTNNAKSLFDVNIIHPEDLYKMLNIWEKNILENKTLFTITHRIKSRDGIYKWFLTRSIKNESGIWFGTCTDINDIIVSEEQTLIQNIKEKEIEKRHSTEIQQAEKTRIILAEGAKILASDAIEKEIEKEIAEKIRIKLCNQAKMLAQEKKNAETTRLLLAEGAKTLAKEVIEKEQQKKIAETTRLLLAEGAITLAKEVVEAEKTRLLLAEGAKTLAKEVLQKEQQTKIAENTRLLLAEGAKTLAKEVVEAENTRLLLVEDAKNLANEVVEKEHEKQIAETTRLLLVEDAKNLAKQVLQKEEEKQIAETTRLLLAEEAKILAKKAVDKEFEKKIAEEVRIKLSDYAKVLAINVLEKDIERNLAEHTRIVLSRHAKVLAGEVLVTNQLLLQMQLEKVYLNKSNMETIAEMSHEIRNPLNGVIGIVELMSEIDLIPELKDYVDKLKEASSMLLIVVNDVLDISKIDAGKLQIECIKYKPFDIITDLFMVYLSIVESKGFTLIQDVDKEQAIYGDPHRIKQILNNLLSNAIKFTSSGSITIRTYISDGFITYYVIDTGIGIEETDMHKLFKSYSQTNSSISRLYGGSGLGLSICNKLVNLMHGKIYAESTIGSGSTFWFKIPLQNEI
jgi:signal transduction histidine kinase